MFKMIYDTATLEIRCPVCGRVEFVELPMNGFIAWMGGESIEDAFPTLTNAEYDQLKSGICPDCWAEEWLDDDEEEFEEFYESAFDETGYNPYLGCYDFDC